MRIVTDSKRPEEPKNPDESTIYQLYQHFASKDEADTMRKEFTDGGLGYGDAKKMLFETIELSIKEPRERYYDLLEHPDKINEVLQSGAERARKTAAQTVNKVFEAMLGKVA